MNDSSVRKPFHDAAAPKPGIKKKRPAPLSIRLNDDEKARLQQEAESESVHALARRRLLGADAAPGKRVRRTVGVDRTALAQVLAKLGQSRLSSNMNQIAKAVNKGALPASDGLCRELRRACSDIAAMRVALIKALNITPKD